jgi:hypothetical protein
MVLALGRWPHVLGDSMLSTLPPPPRRGHTPLHLTPDHCWSVAYHHFASEPHCPCCAAVLPLTAVHLRAELEYGFATRTCTDCGLDVRIEPLQAVSTQTQATTHRRA